jgi:hypothetical protein
LVGSNISCIFAAQTLKQTNMLHKISWEIELDVENPLAAAKEALSLIQDGGQSPFAFYVQAEGSKDVFSVDLNEDDEDAVLLATDYSPLIK